MPFVPLSNLDAVYVSNNLAMKEVLIATIVDVSGIAVVDWDNLLLVTIGSGSFTNDLLRLSMLLLVLDFFTRFLPAGAVTRRFLAFAGDNVVLWCGWWHGSGCKTLAG